ncbi:MAG: glucan biosynthesis protein [Hyphomicrobiales bacterium]|nr:glucan biosynthesis protein [Hyphomicrobiales bacterium]
MASSRMTALTRRRLLAGIALSAIQPGALASAAEQAPGSPDPRRAAFSYDDVVNRARALSGAPFDPAVPALPAELAALDFDAWRDIRFRADKDLLGDPAGRYKLQFFHLGHLFKRPVAINLVHDGIASPLTYSATEYDYHSTRFSKPLAPNLGHAGFRVHYPLNSTNSFDELISFVGASYFRFLGRDQKYGLSARGLSIGTGNLDNNEEFPFFKEFWIERPDAHSEMLSIYALLDSPSLAGAYRFDIYPQNETAIVVTASLFARRTVHRIGMAPLTSMFFLGENDRHMNDRNKYDEFRSELHDSDGLMIHTNTNEWIWRPLKNPQVQEVQRFRQLDVKGFGLFQRDRQFDHYKDIELNYEERPSYWIEPTHDWGAGVIELVELATKDETADNIICAFVPDAPLEPGTPFVFSYRMRTLNAGLSLHKLGTTRETFSAPAAALGSNEELAADTRRFLVDFTGGDLEFYLKNPSGVKISTSSERCRVLRTFLVPNPKDQGFRAMVDVRFEPDQVGSFCVLLKGDHKPLTETWCYAWRNYHF